jgi:hypothetical protein
MQAFHIRSAIDQEAQLSQCYFRRNRPWDAVDGNWQIRMLPRASNPGPPKTRGPHLHFTPKTPGFSSIKSHQRRGWVCSVFHVSKDKYVTHNTQSRVESVASRRKWQCSRPWQWHGAGDCRQQLSTTSSSVPLSRQKLPFETKRVCGRCLQLTHTYLLSIPSTSVEAEGTFSAAGVSCNKFRSCLSDSYLDNLCLLRSFYQNKRQ